MFKFIHAADIHLDSPLLNLDQYDGAPSDALRVATREAFDNLIRLAIEEQVDFLLIAGDLYDKDSPDFNTPRHVRKKFRELQSCGIRVFVIQGNHDAEATTKKSFAALSFPDNVHLFSTKKAETVFLENRSVAIHGQGFATRAVEEDLSASYPAAVAGHFNIGMLHTNLGGSDSHDNYAPSTADGLRGKDYQYWALGHIHKRREEAGGPKRQIRYSGNTQGRHIGEIGAKGCLLVEVNESQVISVRFHATDVWRWALCEVDATELETAEDVLVQVRRSIEALLSDADGRSLAVRVLIKGRTLAHRRLVRYVDYYQQELRRLLVDAFDDRVWLEKVRIKTAYPQETKSEQVDSAHGELVAAIQSLTPDNLVVNAVRGDLEKMIGAIPADPRFESLRLDLDDPAMIETLVKEAQEFLVATLLDPSSPPEQGEA